MAVVKAEDRVAVEVAAAEVAAVRAVKTTGAEGAAGEVAGEVVVVKVAMSNP